MLACAVDPASAAELTGVSTTTARTHLARLLHEAKSHRQGGLVALPLRTGRVCPECASPPGATGARQRLTM